jgi:hypothetical protein
MRWTAQLLIVLALSSLGCAPGDWTTETLTLVDLTGTWEGPVRQNTMSLEGTTRWVLQQKGQKVRGDVQGPGGASVGSVEGLVNGEVFSWHVVGRLTQYPSTPSRAYRGEATITLDEISGRADGPGCPCTVLLRRTGSDSGGKKAQ